MTHFMRYIMMTLIGLTVLTLSGPGRADGVLADSGWPTGTWYLALDTEIYGLPPGFPLSGLAQINRDGTLTIVDGGDFGQSNFLATRNLAQFGSWRRVGGHGIEAITLFLEADMETGEVLRWVRGSFLFWQGGGGVTTGTVNTAFLPCAPALPPPSPLTCPDPIENADQFIPFTDLGDPADVPVTLKRLLPGK
ncbi:MAG TPA: hypothetical protein VKN35_00165 [Xanthomonadales bacterium]|nr:hypothetical protein [Xanthomonadales bacterium]